LRVHGEDARLSLDGITCTADLIDADRGIRRNHGFEDAIGILGANT